MRPAENVLASLNSLMNDLEKNLGMFSKLMAMEPASCKVLEPVYNELKKYAGLLKQKEDGLSEINRFGLQPDKFSEIAYDNKEMDKVLLNIIPVLDQQFILLRLCYQVLTRYNVN